ncbi:ATP-binding protein [Streptomyces sp. Wb2n-11]|uniref:ATP-binding protein n=1 Tax=Streptomyces sp. Wb2n-11 TaxID=1030533 RepID=UPI000B807DED|nr:ATP-binding protein [Streptomyces sp. Wb2n-11]
MNSRITTARTAVSAQRFTQLLGATRRGARLARLLAVQRLDAWGWPPDNDCVRAAELVVAELAANAVLHGRVPGRGFRLGLALVPVTPRASVLRIDVTDPRGDLLPLSGAAPADVPADGDDAQGRGLLLVSALSVNWGFVPEPAGAKTAWAVVGLVG